jgi:hypothetical protein
MTGAALIRLLRYTRCVALSIAGPINPELLSTNPA